MPGDQLRFRDGAGRGTTRWAHTFFDIDPDNDQYADQVEDKEISPGLELEEEEGNLDKAIAPKVQQFYAIIV